MHPKKSSLVNGDARGSSDRDVCWIYMSTCPVIVSLNRSTSSSISNKVTVALDGNGWPVKGERKAKASLSFPGRTHRFPVVLVGSTKFLVLPKNSHLSLPLAFGHMAS